jgi:hypothetical protein
VRCPCCGSAGPCYCFRNQSPARPRNTGYQPARKGNPGVIGPLLVIAGAVALLGFWPAMVWHGQTATGGWRWDDRSTAACCIWWAACALFFVLGWANEQGKHRLPPPPPVRTPVPPGPSPLPACAHGDAVRVGSVLDEDETVAWWCPACETRLDAGFAPPSRLLRSCCRTDPATPHWYRCPQWTREWPPPRARVRA